MYGGERFTDDDDDCGCTYASLCGYHKSISDADKDSCEATVVIPIKRRISREVLDIEDHITRYGFTGLSSEDLDGYWY